LATYTQKIIINESKKGLYLLEITNSNILRFYSYDMTTNSSTARVDEQFDLTTNQFITLTPTP